VVMGRPRLHDDDRVLDAARDLVLERGGPGTTTAALTERSGVPTGSLYHRFRSRDGLLAALWLRTVRRFQEGLLAAARHAAPGLPRALAAAGWTVTFASAHPADARLLLSVRREELVGPAAALREDLAGLNDGVVALLRRLAAELAPGAAREAAEVVAVAVVDLPYAVVRRHLTAGTDPGRSLDVVEDTVTALLARFG